MKIPIKGAFIARGDEAEMWTNVDGCEDWIVCKDPDEARQKMNNTQETEG
jgi:sarcosine oxidase delta subunit